MSRVSVLRDDVADALSQQITGVPVVAVAYPEFTNEELADGPRLFVRFSNRAVEMGQGIDSRNAVIHVGIIGKTTPTDGSQVNPDDNRAQTRTKVDQLDAILERVLDLFSPQSGALRRLIYNEHRLDAIAQPSPFDSDYVHEQGVFVSYLELTFFDTRDN